MPRILRFVVLCMICFSVVAPSEAAIAADVEAQSRARGVLLIKKLDRIMDQRGIKAAQRAFKELKRDDQRLVERGLETHKVRVKGPGAISKINPPKKAERIRDRFQESNRVGENSSDVTAAQAECYVSVPASYTHESLWVFDLYTYTQTITWCQDVSSSGTPYITYSECSATGQGHNAYVFDSHITECDVSFGGAGWTQVKYLSQGKFENVATIKTSPQTLTPVIEQQVEPTSRTEYNYWRWHNGDLF